MKTKMIGIMLVTICWTCFNQALAENIAIKITGEVTDLGGYAEVIPDTIHTGVPFTGIYMYDSSTLDSNPSNQRGEYVHNSPYGITLTMGGYEFKTASNHAGQFDMQIGDDQVGNGIYDIYWVRSYENVSTPSVDFTFSIEWKLMDYIYHTALSSGNLPLTAPVLTEWDHNDLKIYGSYGPNFTSLAIYGTVTQAVLVPEPLTGILMAMGVFLIRRKR